MKVSNTFVLYHDRCTDGSGARAVAFSVLGDSATYIAVNYNQPVPEAVLNAEKDSVIYILDFCYSQEILEQLMDKFYKVVVLDHHKSAMAALANAKVTTPHELVFHMRRSGASLAWEYFYPGKPTPKLIQYIQDRDLWTKNLPNCDAIHAGIRAVLKEDALLWQSALMDWEDWEAGWEDRLLSTGNVLIESTTSTVKSNIGKAAYRFLVFKDRVLTVALVNATAAPSETGEALCSTPVPEALQEKGFSNFADFAIIYSIQPDMETVSLSLRSLQGAKIQTDVSEISKAFFGGGGHANASGGKISVADFFELFKEHQSEPTKSTNINNQYSQGVLSTLG